MQKNIPRIVIAAPRSGSGKTLISIGLMRALTNRGLKVNTFKGGPDYIDPMFHKKILGIPSKNLDLFFTDEEKTRSLFVRDNSSDISVIEGVMGLYDGVAGISSEASTYHLAKALRAPVILVIDAHGMGVSVLAEISGFVNMDEEKLIAGIILNKMSRSYFDSIAPLIEERFDIPVLGCFPVNKELNFESRHLGLMMPNEINELDKKIELCSKAIEENLEVDKILEIAAKNALEVEDICKEALTFKAKKSIAVARDEAFCFIYEDNIRLLEKAGCDIIWFSPLRDKELPQNLDGLILYGGYPELYAKELSQNVEMLASIKKYIENGGAYLAECGGFMYLHEAIVTKDNEEYRLVGSIKGKCSFTGKLVRFGYATFEIDTGKTKYEIKGHEFHYYDSDNNGEEVLAKKPLTNKSWSCCHKGKNYLAGFPHFYYESQPELIYSWLMEKL